jgi:phosphonate transport system substrate-binding protein
MATESVMGAANLDTLTRFQARPGIAVTAAMILAVFLVLSAIMTTAYAQDGIDQQHVYRIGVVPQFEQRKLFSIWIPILEELEARTGLRFEVVGSDMIPEFEKLFLAGDFDFAYMNPYHVVSANNMQGYLPLVCDGSRKLQGILVVRKDSPIKTIEELRGQVVAFPSANALGASLMPRSELMRNHGIEVIPEYVKTHTSVYLHVAQGLTTAGGGVASTLRRQKAEVRDSLRILYLTSELIPHPIVAHPRVPKNHVRLVKEALLAMGESEKGRALLANIPMRSVTEASFANYEPIIKLGLEEFRGPM